MEELFRGMPEPRETARVMIRLLAAIIFGGLIGYNRERAGKEARLPTHMLVALGACVFVVVPVQMGMADEALARVVEGVATGIGFLGAGAILKAPRKDEIEGLTTAAGIWLTAGVGAVTGLGGLGIALSAIILAWLILTAVMALEKRAKRRPEL